MKRRLHYTSSIAVITFGLIIASILPADAQSGQLPKLPQVDKKEHKNYAQKIPGSEVKFDMVAVPGGAYMMGSPPSEKNREADEGPQHPVKVQPFWMSKCEVTWDEYDLYWRIPKDKKNAPPKSEVDKKADAVTKPTRPYADETFGHLRKKGPVLGITHHSAMQYCNWLSIKTGKYYRLPTEAEWEWACRAGTTTAYYFGDNPGDLGEYAWYDENADETTHQVGTKKPNAWGLHDMSGNVSEWCLDHYKKDFYGMFPLDKLTLNPVALPTAERYSHVVRGGSWIDYAEQCRSADRQFSTRAWLKRDPQTPQSIWWMTDADFVGFRVVHAVNEQQNLKDLKSKVTPKSPCE